MENKIFTLHKTVTEADTAAHVGSGSLPVLATPVLIAWMEAAIGEGSHTRAIIRAERFMEKANAKLAQ